MLLKTFVCSSLAALAIAQSFASGTVEASEAGKVDAGHRKPCPAPCPQANALNAAFMLTQNFYLNVNIGNLAGIQAVVDKESTIQTVFQDGDGVCQDSGVQTFLSTFIPLLPELELPLLTITASYVDAKNRVHIFTDELIGYNGNEVSVRTHYIYKPSESTCEYSLHSAQIRQASCVPQ